MCVCVCVCVFISAVARRSCLRSVDLYLIKKYRTHFINLNKLFSDHNLCSESDPR